MSVHANLRRLLPAQANKRIITSFANKHGLVYFGYVNQIDDDHRVLRGLTVSTKHRDEHFCIGSYRTYDVSFVERSDTLRASQSGKTSAHTWHILAIDLHHENVDMPHLFIGLHSRSESFYQQLFTKYSHLRALQLGSYASYPKDFLQHYRVYGSTARQLDIEALIAPEVAAAFFHHFGALAVELSDGCLYIYSEKNRLDLALLDAMMQNGVWLASQIDAKLETAN